MLFERLNQIQARLRRHFEVDEKAAGHIYPALFEKGFGRRKVMNCVMGRLEQSAQRSTHGIIVIDDVDGRRIDGFSQER